MLRTIGLVFERQRAPVVVILEDLHLARGGVGVLAELAPRLRELPVLVVGSLRGEDAPGLAQTIPGAQHMRLGPLARDDIADLAGSMLGRAQPAVVDFLDRHTEGNVFFIVEAVRALAEDSGSLEEVGSQPLPERLVTSGIETVVARRMAKLPEAARGVFLLAAVVGRAIDAEVLANDLGAAPVAEAIAAGTEIAVLEVSDNRFRFSHDKFREYLLDSLDPTQRRELHRRPRPQSSACTAPARRGRPRSRITTAKPINPTAKRRCVRSPPDPLEQGAYDDATRLLERALPHSTPPGHRRIAPPSSTSC